MAIATSTYPSDQAQSGRLKSWLSKVASIGSGRDGQAELLLEAGQMLGDNFESPNHSERFVGQLAKVIDFDYLSLAQVDHTEWTVDNLLQCGARISGMSDTWSVGLDAVPQPEVFSTKLAAMCEVEQVAHDGKSVAWWMYRAGLRSMITAPIIADATVIGVLMVASKLPNSYDEANVRTAQMLADAVAGSFANLRLHKRLRRELIERETVSAIAKIISSSLDIESSMPDFAHDLFKIVPANGVSISLATGVNDDTEDRWSFGVTLVAGDSPHQRTLTSEMKVGGSTVGTITVVGSPRQRYVRHHLSLLNTVASNIAGAIAAAEMHKRSMELAEARLEMEKTEAERRELERVAAAKTDFLTTVSHELRTPLTSILAFADVLTRNKPGNLVAKQERQLGIIQRSGRRLAVLIDDLLDATHIEQSKFELKPVRFDVAEMLTDLTDSFRPILREKDQKFVLNLSQAPTEIFADQIRLTQVVSNLVTNASKYSGEGSEVKIIATSDNDDIVITVEDQGIGIESFDLDHVFGAFFRSDNEGTRAQSGTGIGLYFCRMIVEYHNGDIAAESENGKGTTVTLRMPREYSSELQEETALAA
ncbi:MAG: GAF domain-containing sensor histidine kinase [Chloroflexi bacterium]|jgi:signal transduction histidine kinase|nr:GAF domain-containing sensor histidine kinase [Chloroflexota bacterium]MBT5628219.1 GAF domain-containing sensor histidine kinase [Chloroflexota bacterium]